MMAFDASRKASFHVISSSIRVKNADSEFTDLKPRANPSQADPTLLGDSSRLLGLTKEAFIPRIKNAFPRLLPNAGASPAKTAAVPSLSRSRILPFFSLFFGVVSFPDSSVAYSCSSPPRPTWRPSGVLHHSWPRRRRERRWLLLARRSPTLASERPRDNIDKASTAVTLGKRERKPLARPCFDNPFSGSFGFIGPSPGRGGYVAVRGVGARGTAFVGVAFHCCVSGRLSGISSMVFVGNSIFVLRNLLRTRIHELGTGLNYLKVFYRSSNPLSLLYSMPLTCFAFEHNPQLPIPWK